MSRVMSVTAATSLDVKINEENQSETARNAPALPEVLPESTVGRYAGGGRSMNNRIAS